MCGLNHLTEANIYLRNFINRNNYGRKELVGDRLHALDGGFQSIPNFFMGHCLLRRDIIWQLTVDDTWAEKDILRLPLADF